MQHLEVSGAVRLIYIYIYIYLIRRLKVEVGKLNNLYYDARWKKHQIT